ncbi:MAG: Succinate-semialdehyde dehydrogenase [NADP(+)] 1 [Chroococcidiopsis cubana SAG 39.79]|nr:Succinate-semialdehyde dehydrogenase [NADP(+)] 1 [Chroococcidiopsis cubana SAG 39.79]
MPSADIEAAASTAVTARMLCNGESCIAAKDLSLPRIAEQFNFGSKIAALKVGDQCYLIQMSGPLATPEYARI